MYKPSSVEVPSPVQSPGVGTVTTASSSSASYSLHWCSRSTREEFNPVQQHTQNQLQNSIPADKATALRRGSDQVCGSNVCRRRKDHRTNLRDFLISGTGDTLYEDFSSTGTSAFKTLTFYKIQHLKAHSVTLCITNV